MKIKNIFLYILFCLSNYVYSQPVLLAPSLLGGNEFGTIMHYSAGDTGVAKIYNIPGNPGLGLSSLTRVGNNYYGVCGLGGTNGNGILFRYNPMFNNYTILYNFFNYDGYQPSQGKLLLASNGKLYGTTYGGVTGGVIFEFDINTNVYSKIFDFNNMINGSMASGFLTEGSNLKLYGTTESGGPNNRGVLFEYDILTDTFLKLVDFDVPSGSNPTGALFHTPTGSLIGMTYAGGLNNKGVIFEYDLNTGNYYKRYDFNSIDGSSPRSSFVTGGSTNLYSVTTTGGNNGDGVLFEYDYVNLTYVKKIDFSATSGKEPLNSLIKHLNGKYYGVTKTGGINNYGVIYEYNSVNSTYTKKVDLSKTLGGNPNCHLVEGLHGKLYGTTDYGGVNLNGVIFEFDVGSNIYKRKIQLGAIQGKNPLSALLLAGNGKFYGTQTGGGIYTNNTGGANGGVIYEYDYSSNNYSKKVDLADSIGSNPSSSLIETNYGKLYGITKTGGNNNYGVIFEYDYENNIYSKKFDFSILDGTNPHGALVKAANGKLYGMTQFGGIYNGGVLFEYDYLNNIYTKKINFIDSIGTEPRGSLLEGSNGLLYGMTSQGGSSGYGVIFEYNYLTEIMQKKVDFSLISGAYPYGDLIETTSGVMFGLTRAGGVNSSGTLFQYELNTNQFTKKIDFTQINGQAPEGSLFQASNGKLYGTTRSGGVELGGVIFEYDIITNTYQKKADLNDWTGWKSSSTFVEVTHCIAPGISASGPLSFCSGDSVILSAVGLNGNAYQWKRNGVIIPGAINQNYVATNYGNYTVTVNDLLCVNALTSNSVRVSIPCIPPLDPQPKMISDDFFVDDGLSITYNPSTQNALINSNNLKGNSFSLYISDETGRILMNETGKITNSELNKNVNFSIFAIGMYIVTLITDQEKFAVKFIKVN